MYMSEGFDNPLPGVPSVESPFFKRIFSDPAVDEETRRIARDLRMNGFAVFDFPDTDFNQMADRIKTNLFDRYDWDLWNSKDHQLGRGLRLQDAWKFDDDVRSIAVNQRVLDLLSTLFGRRAWPFQTLNFPVGTQQHYHTDAVHFSSIPERFMCGVWTALEDIDEDSGPLIYFPGSHKWPIFTNEHIGACAATMDKKPTQAIYEPTWRALVKETGIAAQTFTAKKGQSLIWLANLLHGGVAQTNRNKTRWSQVTHYYFEDCAYYTPMLSDPFFGNIEFREVKNVVTGETVPNKYMGNEIPDSFVQATKKILGRLPEGFDSDLYLELNPDVRSGGMSAQEHYRRFGWQEGRRIK